MPAQCHHAATVEMAYYLITHTVERYSVEVYGVAQFKMSEVEANDGGEVATDTLHVGPAAVANPSHAIDGVVLMTNEIAIGGNCVQMGKQVFCALSASALSYRVVSLFLAA